MLLNFNKYRINKEDSQLVKIYKILRKNTGAPVCLWEIVYKARCAHHQQVIKYLREKLEPFDIKIINRFWQESPTQKFSEYTLKGYDFKEADKLILKK